jgi:hypothetical protein
MPSRQRGALSLFRVAVLFGLLAFAAIVGLLSLRHERNLFLDVWRRLAGSVPAPEISQPAPEPIRRCVVDGRVTYTNVGCADGKMEEPSHKR